MPRPPVLQWIHLALCYAWFGRYNYKTGSTMYLRLRARCDSRLRARCESGSGHARLEPGEESRGLRHKARVRVGVAIGGEYFLTPHPIPLQWPYVAVTVRVDFGLGRRPFND